jgi:hypothetical protein
VNANKIILITASAQYTIRGGDAPEVYNLTVSINDGPIYGPAILATREQVMAAVKSRTSKENKELEQRGGPSL